MPLLQGQPFKLVKSPDIIPDDAEIFTIPHTGEKFLSKSEYEDRLALYSQTIWMCQCTGRTGLTHQEAWASEAIIRVSAKRAVPPALHKPLLMLVHHSLSPLDQLVDASSILCYSQFHIGEELMLLQPKATKVCVIKVSDGANLDCFDKESDAPLDAPLANGIKEDNSDDVPELINGASNGIKEGTSSDNSPGKENQSKLPISASKEEAVNRREMLPKLYSVICIEDQKLFEDVPPRNLQRTYKVPSKDQLRLFIRSCALRLRGSTCTPWVVSDDLLEQHNIVNKLPSLFLSSPRPSSQPVKRKAPASAGEPTKRQKQDKNLSKDVKPIIPKPNMMQNFLKPPQPKAQKTPQASPGPLSNATNTSPKISSPTKSSPKANSKEVKMTEVVVKSPAPSPTKISPVTKTPNARSQGRPLVPKGASSSTAAPVVKKRGRPRLSEEEKAQNKRMRQATLFDMASKVAASPPPSAATGSAAAAPTPNNGVATMPKFLKIKTVSGEVVDSVAQYKSPIRKINTSEGLMKLPMMRKLVHEHKTIKGVSGQHRRMAYTMDYVLNKLSASQIDLIPDEVIRKDLLCRQQKVRDKAFMNSMTPEERKEYMRKKARTVALERWKERKLKNLKIEDQTLKNLKPLPQPSLVPTTEGIPNSLFGDIVMITEFIKCFRELLVGEEKFRITSNHMMEAISAGAQGYKVIADIMCCLLSTIIHDDISKNCKELGVPLSVIPVNYQTAPELARLCLKKQDVEDFASQDSDECESQIGKEKSELPEELLFKLETRELWDLNCFEVVAVLKALVHKALSTSSLSVFVEETEEKVGTTLRERRKVLKEMRHERDERQRKRRQERTLKEDTPKKLRGRPRGSSKTSSNSLQDFMDKIKKQEEEASKPVASAVMQRRLSAENRKKEKDLIDYLEKERIREQEDEFKRSAIDKKYEDIVIKRDNLLRRQPIGCDRDHNRYWIFHATTPGLYVERGWVEYVTDYQYVIRKGCTKGEWMKPEEVQKIRQEESPLKVLSPSKSEGAASLIHDHGEKSNQEARTPIANKGLDDNKPLSNNSDKMDSSFHPEDEEPLSTFVSSSKEDDLPLSKLISKSKRKDDQSSSVLASKSNVAEDSLSLSELAKKGTHANDDIPLSLLANKVKNEINSTIIKTEGTYMCNSESQNKCDSLSAPKDEVPLIPLKCSSSSKCTVDGDNKPPSVLVKSPKKSLGENSVTPSKGNDKEDVNVSLAKNKILQKQKDPSVKSKLTLSPMKMATRGKPPKEAYVFVDEDTQTFPAVETACWYYYPHMDQVKNLLFSLSDQGQRESQLAASIALNKDRLQYHYNLRPEPLKMPVEAPDRLKESLKEDIIQIEKELIEGWLGAITLYDEWEAKVTEADDVSKLGKLVIEAQKQMQLKYLKGIMAPEKRLSFPETADSPADYEECEGLGVVRWREEVESCRTYSRLHLLVGIFDNCIKWEKSMACRKCKVCRKSREDPLAQCDKCDTSYHWYCLRPPLKEDPGDLWLCPACVPKKTRRQELHIEEIMDPEDPDEKNDPTFIVKPGDLPTRFSRSRESKADKKKMAALAAITAITQKAERKCKICEGRIGLIFCSRCNEGYHSECHEPPLLTRARKDWVCAACLCPNKKIQNRHCTSESEFDAEGNRVMRRNFFGVLEKIYPKKKSPPNKLLQRDKFGRFIRGGKPIEGGFIIPHAPDDPDTAHLEDTPNYAEFENASSNLPLPTLQLTRCVVKERAPPQNANADKFGRSIRGAKSKALENIANKNDDEKASRRSRRNTNARKNYKDDSEEDSEESEDDYVRPKAVRGRRVKEDPEDEEVEIEVEEDEEEEDEEEEIEAKVAHLVKNESNGAVKKERGPLLSTNDKSAQESSEESTSENSESQDSSSSSEGEEEEEEEGADEKEARAAPPAIKHPDQPKISFPPPIYNLEDDSDTSEGDLDGDSESDNDEDSSD